MANAAIDQNNKPTLTALSSLGDGTIVQLWANPVTHRLLVDSSGGGSASIGGAVTGGTAGSVLFISPSGILAQDNSQFYFQDNATTPSVLATNTNVALSINTSGDLSGTDAVNIYGQMDAFLPNSAITNSLAGLNTDGAFPGYTTSSTRGTGAAPSQLQANDLVGGYFGFGTQGASSPTYQNLAGIAIATTGASANSLGGELRFYTKTDGGSLTMPTSLSNSNAWNNQVGTSQAFYNVGDQNATNFERVSSLWSANVFATSSTAGGTGTARAMTWTVNGGVLGLNNAASVGLQGVLDISRGGGHSTMFSINGASGAATASANYQQSMSIVTQVSQTGTAGWRGIWIAPNLSTVGSSTSYLIDAGTTPVAQGGGTYTPVFQVGTGGIVTMGSGSRIAMGSISSSGKIAVGTDSFSTSSNYGTSGMGLQVGAATYTSTTSAGTISTQGTITFGTPTIAASSATTLTNATNVFVSGAPIQGTNVTITNAYALYVATGNTLLGGNLAVSGTIVNPTISKPSMSATNPTAQAYTPAAAGTATLDLSLSNQHDITMPAGNITIALSNDTNNQIFSVSITQDGTGSRTVTWFGTIRWAGGTVPTLTAAANKRDRFIFVRTGSGTYDGMIAGQSI